MFLNADGSLDDSLGFIDRTLQSKSFVVFKIRGSAAVDLREGLIGVTK